MLTDAGASAHSTPTLRVTGLVKTFPGTVALRGLDFEAYPGRVHALLGANGAGKSTLIKILAQLYSYDSGTIEINGRPLVRSDAARISFIHQDLGLVDELTVAENIAIASGFTRRHGFLDHSATRRRAATALAAIESDIDPGMPVGELTRADKSMVAIARALSEPKDLIFLDEPTASLHAQEVSRLFDVVKLLKKQGAAIVYVTHRLDEVFSLCDEVSVVRDGLRVFNGPVASTNTAALVSAITGDKAPASRSVVPTPGPIALRASNVQVRSGATASFDLRGGEIVGAAGLQGAGHTEIGRAICGLGTLVSGDIELEGRPVVFNSTTDAIAHGVVFVTSNRETEGVAYDMTSQENLFLNPGARQMGPLKIRRRRIERAEASRELVRFGVRPPEPARVIATLSGGNQQKVVLGRCLALTSSVIILEEPTMGVDVGGRADIFGILRQAAAEGKAIMVMSTNFEELAIVCDRVLVFDRGAIIDELTGSQINVPTLTRVASGGANV